MEDRGFLQSKINNTGSLLCANTETMVTARRASHGPFTFPVSEVTIGQEKAILLIYAPNTNTLK